MFWKSDKSDSRKGFFSRYDNSPWLGVRGDNRIRETVGKKKEKKTFFFRPTDSSLYSALAIGRLYSLFTPPFFFLYPKTTKKMVFLGVADFGHMQLSQFTRIIIILRLGRGRVRKRRQMS